MSMGPYDAENTFRTRNAVAEKASRAASMIDEGVHRGADTVASMAHQTADQLGRATDYMWNRSEAIRERAAGMAEMASQHRAYSWIALGLVAFGLGYFLRGSSTAK